MQLDSRAGLVRVFCGNSAYLAATAQADYRPPIAAGQAVSLGLYVAIAGEPDQPRGGYLTTEQAIQLGRWLLSHTAAAATAKADSGAKG